LNADLVLTCQQFELDMRLFMSFLNKIYSLFRTNGGNREKVNELGKLAIDPTDHKFTSEERKLFSIQFLKQKGVPVIEHLPLIEDHTTAKFRKAHDIASKIVVLYGLTYVANHAEEPEVLIKYYKQHDLWDYVSPEERNYLAKEERTSKDDNPITWRIEAIIVMLWSLGKFDKLLFPDAECQFPDPSVFHDIEKDPAVWIMDAKLRNTEEILNEADLIYRTHWAARDAQLNGRPMPAGINYDVIMERHFALNWLTMYAEDWDDITTDT
jgi:hypothetical protein